MFCWSIGEGASFSFKASSLICVVISNRTIRHDNFLLNTYIAWLANQNKENFLKLHIIHKIKNVTQFLSELFSWSLRAPRVYQFIYIKNTLRLLGKVEAIARYHMNGSLLFFRTTDQTKQTMSLARTTISMLHKRTSRIISLRELLYHGICCTDD